MYDSWDMERETEFFLILDHFLPFYPPPPPLHLLTNHWKNEKNPRDIIILHKCMIHHNHIIYGSWDINCKTDFLSSWTIFFPFTPLTAVKLKIAKNEKNIWRYHNFTKVYQKSWSQAIPEIWHLTHVIIFHFGLFLVLLPP